MPLCRGQELDFPWTSDEAKSSLDKKYLYGKKLNNGPLVQNVIGLLQWSTRQ